MVSVKDESLIMRLMEKVARVKFGEVALIKLEQLAAKMGVDERRLLELYVNTKNAAYKGKFADTPFSQRIILLPQCLRSMKCRAERTDYGYRCVRCGACEISKIMDLSEKLGYKGVYIVSGGSVVEKILAEVKPRACIGVACMKELVLGVFLTDKLGVIVQAVKLLKDGCVETIVDWTDVMKCVKLGCENPFISSVS